MPLRKKLNLLLITPACALLLLAGSYFGLRGQLAAQVARHAGNDGAGYSAPWVVLLVVAALAVLAFGVGAWACLDFFGLGHWYQGSKSIVVCFLAGGYGLVALGLVTVLAALERSAQPAGLVSVGYGLLGLLAGFIVAAVLLVRVLPAAQPEELGSWR